MVASSTGVTPLASRFSAIHATALHRIGSMVRPFRYVRTRDSAVNSEVVMALLHALEGRHSGQRTDAVSHFVLGNPPIASYLKLSRDHSAIGERPRQRDAANESKAVEDVRSIAQAAVEHGGRFDK
jgi:hypothetical protein